MAGKKGKRPSGPSRNPKGPSSGGRGKSGSGSRGAGGASPSPGPSSGGRRGAAQSRAAADRAAPAPKSGGSRPGGPKGGGTKGGTKGGGPKGGGSRSQVTANRPGGTKRGRPKGLGGDHVEGRQAVRELLLAGNRRVHEVLMIEDLDPAGILEDITELSIEMNLSFKLMNRRRFESEALTQSHQGVMARAQPLPEAELDDLALTKGAFLLVLDGVTDPGNLGAMLRTAECAGVTGVVMPKHRAVHITPTAAKNAAGAIEHLPMALVGGIPRAISRMQELGVITIGLDGGGDDSLFDLELPNDVAVALVMGSEGDGLSQLTAKRVDYLANIPMKGRLNSLNVAMASAVACFEVVRRRATSAN